MLRLRHWFMVLAVCGLTAPPFTAGLAAQDAVAEQPPATEEVKDKEAKKPPKEEAKAETKADSEEQAAAKLQVRLLVMSGQYVDQLQGASLDPTSLLLGGSSAKQKSFYRLCEYLDELAADEETSCVVFDLSDSALVINSAQLDELTRRLSRLKQANKKMIAWLESASNVHLAIAACCDHVMLADFGGIDMPSAALESMFYRDAMDLVGVQASVVRAGDFKGAVEPYLNPQMSDHLRQHYLDMLQSINGATVSRLAKLRGLPVAEVRKLQQKRMLLPKQALASGLVDQLAPYGSMREKVEEFLGDEVEWITAKKKPKKQPSFFELVGTLMAGPPSKSGKAREASIAVLHLSGDIIDGKKPAGGSIVSGPTVEAINELAADDNVHGVVVRVNSPGGSATASEVIRQALAALAKKKPTVISMGSVAASGGYWVSCIGEPIYAETATVTGSIGVFAMKLSFGSLMRRVGVRVEAITLDDSAAAFALDRTWSDADVATLQESIDDVYGRFLQLVSTSRQLPLEQVEPLAGGRVWSGEQAKAHGLVDAIGGLDDCLVVIAKKADLEDYDIIHRPLKSSGFDLMELLGEAEEEEIFSSSLIRSAVGVLKSRGFRFETTGLLLRDAISQQGGVPTIWALHPAELQIR
ncbi:signal peptide peptidase SppA [Planctomycetaceae bacterium SH139]